MNSRTYELKSQLWNCRIIVFFKEEWMAGCNKKQKKMFCYVCFLFGVKDSGIITAFRPEQFHRKCK